ncbi:UNVERIFIED_ORG: hypothetical protein J2W74_003431 [Methylorubrum zatmanii]
MASEGFFFAICFQRRVEIRFTLARASPTRGFDEAAALFLGRRLLGAEAVCMGWTTPQLFGAHPAHCTLRIDWCGVMITGGHKAVGIEPNRILFGNVSGYRDTLGAPTGIPIWEFAAQAQNA